MTSLFSFATTPESEAYCLEVVHDMVRLFEIDKAEAVQRFNEVFGNRSPLVGEAFAVFAHEVPDYWAKSIYYAPEPPWWKVRPDQLKPRPLKNSRVGS